MTVIEILSPDNKVARSQGLKSFGMKRVQIMRSPSHWVEIDLLHRGSPSHCEKGFVLTNTSCTSRRPIDARKAWCGRFVCRSACQ